MKSKPIALGLLSAFVLNTATADDALHRRAERHLSDLLYSKYYLSLHWRLRSSGLPYSDVESVIENVIGGYASCALSRLASAGTFESAELVGRLAAGYSIREINRYFGYLTAQQQERFFASLENDVQVCVLTVSQEYGLVSN